MSNQPELFDCDPESFLSNLDRTFLEWMKTREGQTTYREFVKRSLKLRSQGYGEYGARCILEAIRFDHDVTLTHDAGDFKINNNHTARLARMAMNNIPELRGFFSLRRMKD